MKYSGFIKNKIRKKRMWFSVCVTPLGIKLGGLAKYWGSHHFFFFFFFLINLFLQPSKIVLFQSSVNTRGSCHLFLMRTSDVLYLYGGKLFVTSSLIIIVTEAVTGSKCFFL